MRFVLYVAGLCYLLLATSSARCAEVQFPPLKVAPGFKATLFAVNPMIEYPSVIAAGPREGSVLVAVDNMYGVRAEKPRPDEIRLVEDTDGDGIADKATVFARGFNSI